MMEDYQLEKIYHGLGAIADSAPELRDRFAMAVLSSIASGDIAERCAVAYEFADGMLEARKRAPATDPAPSPELPRETVDDLRADDARVRQLMGVAPDREGAPESILEEAFAYAEAIIDGGEMHAERLAMRVRKLEPMLGVLRVARQLNNAGPNDLLDWERLGRAIRALDEACL